MVEICLAKERVEARAGRDSGAAAIPSEDDPSMLSTKCEDSALLGPMRSGASGKLLLIKAERVVLRRFGMARLAATVLRLMEAARAREWADEGAAA